MKNKIIGSYTQYLVMTYNGRESEKENMYVCVCVYIYITESLCCTPETNTTLLIKCTPN